MSPPRPFLHSCMLQQIGGRRALTKEGRKSSACPIHLSACRRLWASPCKCCACKAPDESVCLQVSYMILQRVSPVTHSIGNCLKRVIVIVASVIFFQNPMSQQNMLGMPLPIVRSSRSAQTFLLLSTVICMGWLSGGRE